MKNFFASRFKRWKNEIYNNFYYKVSSYNSVLPGMWKIWETDSREKMLHSYAFFFSFSSFFYGRDGITPIGEYCRNDSQHRDNGAMHSGGGGGSDGCYSWCIAYSDPGYVTSMKESKRNNCISGPGIIWCVCVYVCVPPVTEYTWPIFVVLTLPYLTASIAG